MDGKDQKVKIKAEPKSDHETTGTVSGVPQSTISTQNIVVQMMDIAEPLKTLRTLLAPRLHCSLKKHAIHLQGASGLNPDKSLLEQGVKAEGIVQFSVQVNSSHGVEPVINILDIVKPIIETVQIPVTQPPPAPQLQPQSEPQGEPQPQPQVEAATPSVIEDTAKELMLKHNEQVTELIVCNNYREEQEKLNIPLDPGEWTSQHTEHWINWAASEFGVDPSDNMLKTFKVSGDKLCSLTREDFTRVLPNNTGDLMWTHLQVLIKTKDTPELAFTPSAGLEGSSVVILPDQPLLKPPKPPRNRKPSMNSTSEERILHGNRTGNNGQIQLWQFLLELLTDYKSLHCIHWVGNDGEFKLLDAELVAQKWGERKHKTSMNYEKLSRALRYYYDGDMIAKVHGKRFVYKFVCDLKELIGYDAAEMKKLVLEAQEKHDIEIISTAAALLT